MNSDSAWQVRVFDELESLPSGFVALFPPARGGSFFRSHAFFQVYERHWLWYRGSRLRLYGVQRSQNGEPVALLPAIYSRLYPLHPKSRVLHFLQPENGTFGPLLAPGVIDANRAMGATLDFLRDHPHPPDIIRISPLEPESPLVGELPASLRGQLYLPRAYQGPSDLIVDLAENTAEDEPDEDQAAFAAAAQPRFELIQRPEALALRWPDLQGRLDVDSAHTNPEPLEFVSELMRAAADAGVLRLGVLHAAGSPVAAQLWVSIGDTARCVRAWTARRDNSIEANEVLTHRLIGHMIESDQLKRLNFGSLARMAAGWTGVQRERYGILAFNLRTSRGLRQAARDVSLRPIKAAARRLLRR